MKIVLLVWKYLKTYRNKSKYFKVIKENSVFAFIVKEDFKHFKKGDVLKPAGWKTPALNSARGNVLNGTGAGLFINPIRTSTNAGTAATTVYPLLYNTSTSEFTYTAATSGVASLNYVASTGILSATSFNTVSDRTLKTDIHDLELQYSIDLLKKIRPVSYSFKYDTSIKRFGFIAQEVEQVLTERLGLHSSDPEGKNPQSIAYQELVAPFVKIINNLLERVEFLEKKCL